MKIAIIGAGVAGLISLKRALEDNHDCDCFEETDQIGGVWVYTDNIGFDENGMKVYKNMYKNLYTNIPKQVMEFIDFPHPEETNSYLTQGQVLQYLKKFVHVYDLQKYIKYHETISKVQLLNDERWTVTAINVRTKSETSKVYDAVFVCNGHFRHPRVPNISGQDGFKGIQMHSCDYRSPDLYKDKRVLMIGASFSGVDITEQIRTVTKKVYLSCWASIDITLEGVVNKPSVMELQSNEVLFVDGTKESVDIVMYCTGYEYKFPFLDNNCGIIIEDNWVRSLYKHVVNIEHPTMFFIGIPYLISPFLVSDIQVQFSLAALGKRFTLPSKQGMLRDLNDYVLELKREKVPQRHTHRIGFKTGRYLAELTQMASLKPIPQVLNNIYYHKIGNFGKKPVSYIILDDENFIEC